MAENARLTPERAYCADCGAEAQRFESGLRCPWATASSHHRAWVDGMYVLSCGRPFERERHLVLPTQTRSR